MTLTPPRIRDPGQADWTISLLLNDRFAAVRTAESAAWNGHGWVVGSNIGVFHSATGESPPAGAEAWRPPRPPGDRARAPTIGFFYFFLQNLPTRPPASRHPRPPQAPAASSPTP